MEGSDNDKDKRTENSNSVNFNPNVFEFLIKNFAYNK